MKKILVSLFLIPLCSCVNNDYIQNRNENLTEKIEEEKLPLLNENNTNKVESKVEKKVENIVIHVPKNIENVTQNDIAPINAFDKVAMQMACKFVSEELKYDQTYYVYMKFFDKEWARLQRNSISHIPDWRTRNIDPLVKYSDTLFYPFGGPDIIYAMSFFPNAKDYVLVGLERIGSFFEIEKVINQPETFNQIQSSLKTYLR
ncbi:MAG: hypothetical protein IJ730_01275, partial [Alphaproteobacteria bacterium]|nr:hypothetical protein [Alphaproteobacteria bacterium]